MIDIEWVKNLMKTSGPIDIVLSPPIHERAQHFVWSVPKSDTDDCPLCTFNQAKPRSAHRVLVTTPRQHEHRRNQTLKYHRRIQKKWNKRAATDPRMQVTDGIPRTLWLSTETSAQFGTLVKHSAKSKAAHGH